jgi:hypothetical protein
MVLKPSESQIVVNSVSGKRDSNVSKNHPSFRDTDNVKAGSEEAGNDKITYPWITGSVNEPLYKRFPPPDGFTRVITPDGSFASWLRELPLKPENSSVLLFDGSLKQYQEGHAAVLDIDTGNRDLQQCVDACVRLRAEYLWSRGQTDKICFTAVSGKQMQWNGGTSDYKKFRKYINNVFGAFNTRSALKMMKQVAGFYKPEIGNIYLNRPDPDSYGHAITVMDAAEDEMGRMAIIVAQSYMPAQEIHLLKNLSNETLSPWYIVVEGENFFTPEWTFNWSDLYRYPQKGCTD